MAAYGIPTECNGPVILTTMIAFTILAAKDFTDPKVLIALIGSRRVNGQLISGTTGINAQEIATQPMQHVDNHRWNKIVHLHETLQAGPSIRVECIGVTSHQHELSELNCN